MARVERRRLLAYAEAPPLPPAHADEAAGHEDPGQHAGHEQVADGDAADHGVEDHRDGGRDQDVDHRRGRVVGRAQPRRVALAPLPRDQHRAERAGVGHRAAGDAAEHHGADHGGGQRAAAQPLHQLAGEAQQLLAQLAFHDQGAGQDEEGQREHREGLGLREHLLRHQQQRQVAVPQQGGAGGDDERVRHREHRDHERDEGDDEDEAHVGISSGLGWGMASGPMSAMRSAVVTVPRASSAQPAAIAQ